MRPYRQNPGLDHLLSLVLLTAILKTYVPKALVFFLEQAGLAKRQLADCLSSCIHSYFRFSNGVKSSLQALLLLGLSLMLTSHSALQRREWLVFTRVSADSKAPWPRCVGFLSANGEVLRLGLGSQRVRFRGGDIGCLGLALSLSLCSNAFLPLH